MFCEGVVVGDVPAAGEDVVVGLDGCAGTVLLTVTVRGPEAAPYSPLPPPSPPRVIPTRSPTASTNRTILATINDQSVSCASWIEDLH